MKKELMLWLVGYGLFVGCAAGGVWTHESGPRPDWVQDDRDWWEEKGEWRFRGRVENADDVALGLREAEAEAVKVATERFRMVVSTEFSAYARRVGLSAATTEKFVSDGVAWVSKSIPVSGIHPVASWYRGIHREGYSTSVYECHRLMAITKGDYEATHQAVLRKVARDAEESGDQDLEKVARELLEKTAGEER